LTAFLNPYQRLFAETRFRGEPDEAFLAPGEYRAWMERMRGSGANPFADIDPRILFAAENFGEKNNRPIVRQTKKRRPLSRPLIAIGNDRLIITPNEAVARFRRRNQANLRVSSVIIPDRKVAEGILIRGTTVAWLTIAETLRGNWSLAFSIPPERWEEIIAGAYERAGYDEVILTPRSGDFGRDVIAIKSGIGCIKIIGSVKAYSPGNLVKHDDVRALLGVLSGEPDVSKGIITTTSDFAPRIVSDPIIKPFMPTRLELMNGERLQKWLASLL
jgi:restriction system protein